MKKMSIVTVLVMLVTLTAYSVSGTYAKYTSQIDMTDDARVAKWSFTLKDSNATEENPVHTLDLFSNSYKFDGKSKLWVSSFDKENVVAPGTEGNASFVLNGSIETAFTVDYIMDAKNDFVVYYTTKTVDGKTLVDKMAKTAEELTTAGVAETDVKEYRPILYTITHKRNGADVTAINSKLAGKNAKELADEFKKYNDNNALKLDDHIFTPGTYTLEFNIAWKWDTENTVSTGLEVAEVDKLDTFAGENLSTQKVQFNISAVANQVADDWSKAN